MQVQYLILSLDKNSEIEYVKKTYRDRITVYMYGNPSVESLFVLSMVVPGFLLRLGVCKSALASVTEQCNN